MVTLPYCMVIYSLWGQEHWKLVNEMQCDYKAISLLQFYLIFRFIYFWISSKIVQNGNLSTTHLINTIPSLLSFNHVLNDGYHGSQ